MVAVLPRRWPVHVETCSTAATDLRRVPLLDVQATPQHL
jgi:hypothetical protein